MSCRRIRRQLQAHTATELDYKRPETVHNLGGFIRKVDKSRRSEWSERRSWIWTDGRIPLERGRSKRGRLGERDVIRVFQGANRSGIGAAILVELAHGVAPATTGGSLGGLATVSTGAIGGKGLGTARSLARAQRGSVALGIGTKSRSGVFSVRRGEGRNGEGRNNRRKEAHFRFRKR